MVSLKVCVERIGKIYDQEGRHPATPDIVCRHLGYKDAGNGAAKQALAALGYFGLLERSQGGRLAVSKSYEEFKFAPNEELKARILKQWLRTPTVFAELLEKFPERLPSEASLKFELIQMEFSSATADECLAAFLDSLQFANVTSDNLVPEGSSDKLSEANINEQNASQATVSVIADAGRAAQKQTQNAIDRTIERGQQAVEEENSDRIPVRLANGRKAWLVIPAPFYEADKRRLISQIELLLADDEQE